MSAPRLPATTLPLVIATFSTMLGVGMLAPALPHLTAGQSAVAQGFLVSTFGFARLVVNFPSGYMIDRAGLRPTALTGLLLLIAGSLAGTLATGFPWLVAAMALQGAGSAVFTTASMTALILDAGPERRGAAMAWFQAAILISFSLGPIIGGSMMTLLGPRAAFEIQAVLAILTLAVIPFLSPARPAPRAAGGSAHALLNPGLVGAIALGFATFVARVVVSWVLVPAIAIHQFGLTPDRVGLLVGIATLVNFVAMPVIARLVDGWGAAPTGTAFGIGVLAALALLLALPGETGLWIGTTVLMVSTGAIMPAATVAALDGVPREVTGRAMGLFRMAGDAGLAFGPVIVTGITTLVHGEPAFGYWVIAAIMIAALLIFTATRAMLKPQAA